MYLFTDKEKKEEPFYVLLKSKNSKDYIHVVKIDDNLYKEFLEVK